MLVRIFDQESSINTKYRNRLNAEHDLSLKICQKYAAL